LAADESTGTIKRRFDAIGVENTEDNRRDYREMLFRSTDAMLNCISGVILYDETIWQKAEAERNMDDFHFVAINASEGASEVTGLPPHAIPSRAS